MKDVIELLEVEAIIYEGEEGSIGCVRSINIAWVDPTTIIGIIPGAYAFKNFNQGLVRMFDGNISRGEFFTLLRCLEGNVLVKGQPEELFQKIKAKFAEIAKKQREDQHG